ncbi:MAG: hypothetical protein A2151_03260 [Candidatus Muproteobacteria bacterium RBG_16_65_34]|uniref:TonB-dependent receptor n=1 Tax=Candidatus Muproteobacteria bacterium RBG_16_65_34 TaxID=1817760 RepID=A0A1F6TQQ0_9PROT|nr:MAG: hypothetical protein A2151_03260 [Candidatus Muproteobacteria bacterium RBG_16_65_34]
MRCCFQLCGVACFFRAPSPGKIIKERAAPTARAGYFAACVLRAAAVLLAVVPALHAEETVPVPLTEAVFLGEVPVVLSATRLSQPLSESPASITVIDRQMIEASGALDLPDVLRLVPGFQVGHTHSSLVAVTYHGASDAYSRRLQVLIDGRSVYNAAFGGVLWNDLPLALEDIERIEVIRGPNGAAYGANAFSAVVSIVTRHAADDQGTFAKLTAGDEQTRKGVLRYGGGSDDVSYRGTLSYRTDEGFDNLVDEKRISIATFRTDYRASNRDQLEFQLGYNGGARGDGVEGDLFDPARKVQASNHFEQIRWRRTLTADEDVNLQFYHNYFRTSDTTRIPVNAPLVTYIQDLLSERYDLEFQHTVRPRRDTRLVWGAEARLDRTSGEGWFGAPDLIDSRLYRLFANAEWRLAPDWLLNAGALYEYGDTDGGHVSPRIAINHHLARHHTLRASYSEAVRAPSLFEHRANTSVKLDSGFVLDRQYLGDTALSPERIGSYELGYLGEFPAHGLALDVKIYREEIRDVLTAAKDTTTVPFDPYYVFRNDGDTDTYGAELQVKFRPAPRTQFIYADAYARQRGRMLTDLTPPTYVDIAPSTPRHTRSLLVIHRFPEHLEASLTYHRIGNMAFFSGGDDTGVYDILNLRLAYRLRAGGLRGEIALVGQNLSGDYFDFDNKLLFHRRYLLNLSAELR